MLRTACKSFFGPRRERAPTSSTLLNSMENNISEKPFFYVQRILVVEKKDLNRVLKMPKRPLAVRGFEKSYFLHDFYKIM